MRTKEQLEELKKEQDRREQMTKAERARVLRATVVSQLELMQCICHTGFQMDNDTFRMMLRRNSHIELRWNQLQDRKFKLERFIWKNA